MSLPTSADNAQRRLGRPGVESWFLRAVAPDGPRALWLKATTLIAKGDAPVAEAWCSVFDGEDTLGLKHTVPLGECRFHAASGRIAVGPSEIVLDPAGGRLTGAIEGERGRVAWDLHIRRLPGPLGDPLCLLPSRRLIDAPFPKNKLLTPMPALVFDGWIERDGARTRVDRWLGSQGHNWGAAHAAEYAWAQCLFTDAEGAPFAFLEGATGRIDIGRWRSPRLSLLTVRRAGRSFRFDRLVDLWNQDATIDFPSWTLFVAGPDGEATVAVRADPARMVCLGYDNPDGARSFCLNSKTAAVTLRVNPVDGDGFACHSAFGGALEFLQPVVEPRVRPVV